MRAVLLKIVLPVVSLFCGIFWGLVAELVLLRIGVSTIVAVEMALVVLVVTTIFSYVILKLFTS